METEASPTMLYKMLKDTLALANFVCLLALSGMYEIKHSQARHSTAQQRTALHRTARHGTARRCPAPLSWRS